MSGLEKSTSDAGTHITWVLEPGFNHLHGRSVQEALTLDLIAASTANRTAVMLEQVSPIPAIHVQCFHHLLQPPIPSMKLHFVSENVQPDG